MIIYCKVAKQITESIYKLQEAIENNNIKDESVFVYEYDDIINELFITCKELLTGNIDPSNIKKYSGQFNILNNKDEEQLIDIGKYEKNLIKKVLEYKDVLREAVNDMAPHKVANYLYELAQDFSRFYENCPVAGAPEEKERKGLVEKYLEVMTHGLNILGIEIPEEM